ncbi:MAG: HAD family hydrolase [Thermoplasmatota archaeon]
MSKIKLIATDLDGTLIHDRKIHPIDRTIVKDVLSKNIPVMPATTRMRHSSSVLLKGLSITKYPLICMNGARVTGPGWDDYKSCNEWYETKLELNIAKDISRYADKINCNITTLYKEKKYWIKEDGQKLGQHPEDPTAWLVESNMDALTGERPISYMVHSVRNDSRKMEQMYEYVKENHELVRLDKHHRLGEWMAFTIYPKGTSKRNALDKVLDKLKLSIEDVLAIGDDEVDYELIKDAGIGIAMDDAPEHVKEIADDIAPSCTQQGFAWAISKYII